VLSRRPLERVAGQIGGKKPITDYATTPERKKGGPGAGGERGRKRGASLDSLHGGTEDRTNENSRTTPGVHMKKGRLAQGRILQGEALSEQVSKTTPQKTTHIEKRHFAQMGGEPNLF